MSADAKDEYIENLSNEVLEWCECLVEKGKLDFKQSECNQKFMIVTEAKVVRACELLCTKNKLQLDPSSRRIIVYKISPDVITMAQEKIAEKKAFAAVAPVPKKTTPKVVATTAPESNILQPVTESRKTKAADIVATLPKKQKIVDTTGVKKISSYFAVQPKPPSVIATNSDENTQPHAKSVNSSVSSLASQHTSTHHPSKPKSKQTVLPSPQQNKPPAPKMFLDVPKPMFVVDDYSPFKPEPEDEPFSPCAEGQSSGAANEDLVNFVCQLIATESDRLDTLHVAALLAQMEQRADEAELRRVLSRLEGENKIMLDGEDIYVV